MIPDPKLRARVKSLKEELKTNFGAAHALKSPAHITLQMPFRREINAEAEIFASLKKTGLDQTPFTVHLSGFDSFPPRVIFIRIREHECILQLHSALKISLKNDMKFSERELTHSIHPHMTIATRDLSEKGFEMAWPLYKERPFEDSFRVNSLYLLKHNGKNWDIFHEFPFSR